MIDETSTREEVIKAVSQNGRALEYASEELQYEIVDLWIKHMEAKK